MALSWPRACLCTVLHSLNISKPALFGLQGTRQRSEVSSVRFTAPEPAAVSGGHHRREGTFDADTLLDFRQGGRGDSLGMLLASAVSCQPLYLDGDGRPDQPPLPHFG